MEKNKRARQLICPRKHIFFWQEGFVTARFDQQSAQILAGDVIHHEIIARSVGEKIGNFGEIGVIETRKDSCLAQKLVAGFFSDIFREGAIVFDFLQRTLAALEASIIRKINGSHAALANAFADLITTSQYLPTLERREQSSPFATFISVQK
jgi:hypothetical protein